jgi:hypothetical protein
MFTDLGMLSQKRDLYIKKREAALDRQEELYKKGEKVTAAAITFRIDALQEIIHDLTELIESIQNINSYQSSCYKLINKINK